MKKTGPLGSLDVGFCSWIWRDRIGDEAINLRLIDAMNELSGLDSDVHSAQYPNGYTSYHARLLPEYHPAIQPLAARILLSTERFLTAMGLDRSRSIRLSLTDLFFNVNGLHSSHPRHRHGDAEVSGVYYVKAPAEGAPIAFTSPLDSLMMASNLRAFEPDSPWTRNHHAHQPHDGDLLLFPSWLLHEVSLQNMAVERRSFGINLSLSRWGEQERESGLIAREIPALGGHEQRSLF